MADLPFPSYYDVQYQVGTITEISENLTVLRTQLRDLDLEFVDAAGLAEKIQSIPNIVQLIRSGIPATWLGETRIQADVTVGEIKNSDEQTFMSERVGLVENIESSFTNIEEIISSLPQ